MIKKRKKSEKEEAKVDGRSVAYWCKEIEDARKREKSFRKLARKAVRIYETDESETLPFNILHANTETLKSALYNSIPKPLAGRRFKDADPLSKIASQFITRYLEFFIDSNDRDYSNFDDMVATAVLEGLVPGRGVTRFKYDAAITKEVEATEEADGEEAEPAAIQTVTYENVCGEEVSWDRFMHGYAKRWSDVPWVAFEHFMSKEETEKNFDLKALGLTEIPMSITEESSTSASEEKETNPPKDLGKASLAHIYEIWDKEEKKVIFVCPDIKDFVLKSVDDPLKLSGFFPTPKPLSFGKKVSSMVPVPLYAYYQEQALELNRITIRINNIVKALKVRGFYDSTLEGMEKVLTAGDNELIPVENAAAMQQGQTLEKSIWLMPIERLINVLQQLYIQRTQVKEIIYEITAIADIMRGASQASETLGAQEIKAQWGSLRLKSMQKEVARYVRDCLRIVTEIAFGNLSAETLMETTNMKFPTEAEKAQAKMLMQQLAQQQISSMPGQAPAPPPQIPPEIQAVLAAPSVETLMELLKDNIHSRYKIDIETDSTIALENAGEKQDMAEALNAISQFLNGSMPMVKEGIMPFEAVKAMLLTVARRFKFGTEIEDELGKMTPPASPKPEEKPAGPDPRVELQKLEMTQKAEAEATIFKAKQDEKALAAELAMKERIQQAQILAEAKDKQAQRQLERYKIDQDNLVKVKLAEISTGAALVQGGVQDAAV